MAREIKFRAWYPDAKIMSLIYHWSLSECLAYKINHPERIEIMQFTGLKDKNGKEIYEGDIVQFNDSICGIMDAVIRWDENCGRLRGWNRNSDPKYYVIAFDLHKSQTPHIEIIGNAWENPELLDGKDE